MSTREIMAAAARLWGIRLKDQRPDLVPEGSPERSAFRTTIEDEAGDCFVLEIIAPECRARKRLIGIMLNRLSADGLSQIVPPLGTPAGDHLAYCRGFWWQITPFIPGTPLERPAYLGDAEKGEALAAFLAELGRHTECLHPEQLPPVFSLKDYLRELEQKMLRHDPAVYQRVAAVFAFLRESFPDAHDTLPTTFCHGDYHPLNVIWRGQAVKAVIDWEFCGPKPEIYDAANLLGCLGMEHPSGLIDRLALGFIERMRRNGAITVGGWGLLVEFVIALRLAWLADWLRKKDREMIDLEVVYLNLLLNNRDWLKTAWELPRP